MYQHINPGETSFTRNRKLYNLITAGEITLGGYTKGKIFGMLSCASGKRMNPENRIFFKNEQEALAAGYRPCGRCLPEAYKAWKIAQS